MMSIQGCSLHCLLCWLSIYCLWAPSSPFLTALWNGSGWILSIFFPLSALSVEGNAETFQEERVLRPAFSLLSWQAPAVLIASSVSSSSREQWPAAPRGQQLLRCTPSLGSFITECLQLDTSPWTVFPGTQKADSSKFHRLGWALQRLPWNPVPPAVPPSTRSACQPRGPGAFPCAV